MMTLLGCLFQQHNMGWLGQMLEMKLMPVYTNSSIRWTFYIYFAYIMYCDNPKYVIRWSKHYQ